MDLDALFDAAMAGDVKSIDLLERATETKQVLHTEAINGNTERVRFLLSQFADRNILVEMDGHEKTAFIWAGYYGHTEVAEVFINAAKHLSPASLFPFISFEDFLRHPDKGLNTALHLAAEYGHASTVKVIVEADPSGRHIRNQVGKTPVYLAAEEGYNDVVEIICKTCKAPSFGGPDGSTALHAALQPALQNVHQVKRGASDMIRMMVSAAKRWCTSADFEALFRRKDKLGRTVLEQAMEKNNVDAVKLILQEDPSYQPGAEIKRNDLMQLIYKAIDNKYSDDIIQSLSKIADRIDPNRKDVLELILAIRNRDEASVLRLLGNAKELATFAEDNGWTPLHYAVYYEFDSILSVIIEAQEDVGHQFVYDNLESTPFHVAINNEYTSTLIRLMRSWPALSSAVTDANSPYTAVNVDHRNILHLAAAANNKEMVQGILKYCPEEYKDKILKRPDANGDTPLHLLISHGCFIPELIKHEVLDTMAKNKNNFTPWDMLYFKPDVVADQVHIKIAFDDVQTNQPAAWKFWAKSTEKKTDICKINVPESKRRKKDKIFDEEKKILIDKKYEKKKKELEKYKMRTNTQIIVTALITTVTFTVGFTMPGGLRQSGEVDEGLVLLSKRKAFNAFMVSDALALLLSTSSLFFYFLESMNEDPRQVSKLNAASTILNIVSVMAMMLTFIAGTYVVLSNSPVIAITVCVIGSLFFVLIIFLLIKIVYDRQVKRNIED